jgi:hypothetical protein
MTTDLELSRRDDGSYALTTEEQEAALAARDHVIATNDLGKLAPRQRVGLVLRLCETLGLNVLSRPFEFLVLDGKVVLYPTKSCTEQLGRLHQISVKKVRQANVGDLHVVEVEGRLPNGTTNFASKYVSLRDSRGNPLAGQKLGDAIAKAETGAKRRLILSMVGLAGVPDADDLTSARRVWMDADGHLLNRPSEEQRYLIEHPRAARAAGLPTYADMATADDSPIAGASQMPRPEDLTEPARPDGPTPTFTPSDETVKRHLGAWFASVKGTSLDDADARHRFVRQWTAQYPEGIRTESLRQFFEHATERQAGDLLAHVRAIVDDEKRSLAASQSPKEDDEGRAF